MPDQRIAAPARHHDRGDLAGEGTGGLPVDVLDAENDAAVTEPLGHRPKARERWQKDHLDLPALARGSRPDRGDQVQRLRHRLVHLPVARHQGKTTHSSASRAAMPGSRLPSRSSSVAPPPVETWLTSRVSPTPESAASRSLPQTTLTA